MAPGAKTRAGEGDRVDGYCQPATNSASLLFSWQKVSSPSPVRRKAGWLYRAVTTWSRRRPILLSAFLPVRPPDEKAYAHDDRQRHDADPP